MNAAHRRRAACGSENLHNRASPDGNVPLSPPTAVLPPKGETTHYILCVALLLQNVFAVHPGGGSLLYLSLGIISKIPILVISRLRRLFPLWCLTAPPFPRCAGALWMLSNVPHDSTGKHRANLPLRGRRRRRRQKGCISIALQARFACFPPPARAVVRFYLYWRRSRPPQPFDLLHLLNPLNPHARKGVSISRPPKPSEPFEPACLRRAEPSEPGNRQPLNDWRFPTEMPLSYSS